MNRTLESLVGHYMSSSVEITVMSILDVKFLLNFLSLLLAVVILNLSLPFTSRGKCPQDLFRL